MTVVTCGRTTLSERAEAITRHMRAEQGFRTDGGCGRAWDLDNPIQHMQIARCVACLRWLCRTACIAAHFAESDHDAMSSVPEPSEGQRPDRSAQHTVEEVTTGQTQAPPVATTMPGAGERQAVQSVRSLDPRPASNDQREAAQV